MFDADENRYNSGARMAARVERRAGLVGPVRKELSHKLIWLWLLVTLVLGAIGVVAATTYADIAEDVNLSGQLRYRSFAVRELLSHGDVSATDTGVAAMAAVRATLQRRHSDAGYFTERGFDDYWAYVQRHEVPPYDVTLRHVESADRFTSWLASTARVYLRIAFAFFIGVLLVLAVAILKLVRINGRLAVAEANLQQLAATDVLTGLWNRRKLYETLTEASGGYSVVLADIDNFKTINDDHGHARGDDVLTMFADCLRRLDGCKCFRYGGEEFALLLPGKSLADAMAFAERVRREIESTPLAGLAITASWGIAQWHSGDTSSSVLERADRALYRAKHAGRNRVASETDVPRSRRATA